MVKDLKKNVIIEILRIVVSVVLKLRLSFICVVLDLVLFVQVYGFFVEVNNCFVVGDVVLYGDFKLGVFQGSIKEVLRNNFFWYLICYESRILWWF